MNTEDNIYTASWAMWPMEKDREFPIEATIDQAFKGYMFYPEPEWSKFGYRPPENYPLIGAWRDSEGKVFIFLLDLSSQRQADSPRQFLLYVSGEKSEVDLIEIIIKSLKSTLAKSEKKELRSRDAASVLDGEKKAQSIERLMKLIGLFTVIVNGFSLYLRKLSTPTFPNDSFMYIYQLLLSAVHLTALLLLLLTITISLFYAFRFGSLLLRRMKS